VETRDLFYHHSHNYLIQGRDGWLKFDCDWPGTLPALFRALKQADVRSDELRYLLISHYHIDHAGAAEELKQLGVELIVMKTQQVWLNGWVAVAQKDSNIHFTPISETGNLLLNIDESREFLASFGIHGQVLSTPGHSKDSISLLLEDGSAFIGDLPPIQWAEGFDSPAVQTSWQLLVNAGAKMGYPAHGIPFEVK
jgi:ribonuclease/clavin/mitogillin